jgi:hypothetical protein
MNLRGLHGSVSLAQLALVIHPSRSMANLGVAKLQTWAFEILARPCIAAGGRL